MKVVEKVICLVFNLCLVLLIGSNLQLGLAQTEKPQFATEVAESIQEIEAHYEQAPLAKKAFAIRANSAFIFPPALGCAQTEEGKALIGVILIHDLYSSPYMMQHLGRELSKNCALVYGVKLRGHGTTVSNLDYVHYLDWEKQVDDAFVDLKQKASKVIVIGAGLGAHLGATHILTKENSFDGIVTFSLSYGDCKKTRNSWQKRSSEWGKIEEKTAHQLLQQDDLVTYSELSRNGERQASKIQNNFCKAVARKNKFRVPSLFIFGDRSFSLKKHKLTRLVADNEAASLIFFHNLQRNQARNIRESKLRLVIYDQATDPNNLHLVPDEYLLIPHYDSWYGRKPNFLRCSLASSTLTKQTFCSEQPPKMPSLNIKRNGKALKAYYHSNNRSYEQLIAEIVAFIKQPSFL